MGGFGTVAWVDVKEYDMAKPDVIAVNGAEKTLQVLPFTFGSIVGSMQLRHVTHQCKFSQMEEQWFV